MNADPAPVPVGPVDLTRVKTGSAMLDLLIGTPMTISEIADMHGMDVWRAVDLMLAVMDRRAAYPDDGTM